MSAPGEVAAPVTPRLHGADPSPLLEAAFRRIQRDIMADVPILNPALAVEAVGFDRWQDHWLGVLITPWFMNLVVVPGAAETWQSVAPGLRLFRKFPAGDFAFLGSAEPEVGEFQTCSLFSPMGEFAEQAAAREVARAALDALRSQTGAAPAPEAPSREAFEDPKQAALERPMSKREFLGGLFRRS